MASPTSTRRSRRFADLLTFVGLAIALVAANVIVSATHLRVDLTADRRYSVLPATERLLEGLRDKVYIEVYLEGEFPAGFERLQRSIRETLEEFNERSGGNVEYKFINPSESSDVRVRNQTYQQLVRRGLSPTNLTDAQGGKREEKIIFPGAIVQYAGREQAVLLLKGNKAASSQQRLNQSVESVEYELALGIRKVTASRRKRIAIIDGHGEHNGIELNDLAAQMKGLFELEKVRLQNKVSLDGYDAAIIAKPDSAFSEPDKYKLDQLLVNGGRLLFFVDQFQIKLDSIKPDGTLELAHDLNLDDLLFRYGARINADLLQDINSAYIPMVVGLEGDQPQTQAVPWRYYPIINTFGAHPIVRNLDAVLYKFVSSIDTVKAEGIRKTVLASTSRYTRILPAPVRMSFNDARLPAAPEVFSQPAQAVAVLLEGRFSSLYANRLAPTTEEKFKFKAQHLPGAVLVVSDGDVPLNEFNPKKQVVYPLGFDRTSGITFGNSDLVMNTLSYMLDDEGLIMARNKEVQLRPLDKPRLLSEATRWRAINLVAPLVMLATFGLVRGWRRRKMYR